MTTWVHRLLGLDGTLIYLLVGLLVFAEDAIFIGFLVPGETAAILGGVAASLDHVSLPGMMALVITAAILGDSAGYGIGRWLGQRLLGTRPLRRQRHRLRRAERQLAEKGGMAVFLGRFVTFLHAVMPFLAGVARMPYPASSPTTPPEAWCGGSGRCCSDTSPAPPMARSPASPATRRPPWWR